METENQVAPKRMGKLGVASRRSPSFTPHRKEKDWKLVQEDFRVHFYERYRKEAEDYDKDFMKKYDEDLNTTLVFVGYPHSPGARVLTWASGRSVLRRHWCLHYTGPPSAHPQLQPDSTDEAAALLRVTLYKLDNTTFCGDIPSLPQWTGAPRATIQVQATLYASLAASIFSAFLAMLGKRWLNRYALTDMRGTAVERSQDRQRKLDGIIAWYFDHVMESLLLMLQFALLLLAGEALRP